MQCTDPAAAKVVRALWKRHNAHKATNSTDNPNYWTEHEAIKDQLRQDVTPHLCAAVNADALLKIAAMQGCYRFREPHSFVSLLSNAHDYATEAKQNA